MDDTLLLRKYAEGQDAEAFAELVRRYAGVVYGTCLRITRNAHDAEDVVQESFLELVRRAGSVQKPGPWLHGVAANKARNVVRDAVTRDRHEEQVMPETREEPTWEELALHVDRAIEELPEDLRDVVVQHFLRGQTQAQVAETLGVNQSTVSRQLGEAVQQLRDHLRKAGIVASVAVLGTLLTQNASAAVPATLVATLGKIAIVGAGKAGMGVAAGTTTGILGTVGGKAAVAVAAAAVIVTAGVIVSQHTAKPPPPPLPAIVSPITNGDTNVNQTTLKPDYSKLALKGDDHAKDSFSLTMQAVARLYGIDVDYETIYGLSCNGFAPGIHPPEACRQLQRMHDRGQNLDIVAARLGLVLRPLDLDYRRNPKPWLTIREALDRGEVVVASRGWLDDAYTLWGIILEAPPNGPVNAIRGATQNGRKDVRLDHTPKIGWAITLGKPTLTPEQADIAMLQRAVARIRGDREPFLKGEDEVIYGLKAMDLWIADMKKPSFQPDDPRSSMGNAACCALYSSEGARDTCSYLRRRLDTFPKAARSEIAAAADQYDFIWRTLAPFAVCPGGYATVIGDQARQIEHAEKVLTPCKEAMARAAEHIEKALVAVAGGNMATKVKRDGDRVWIEGVPVAASTECNGYVRALASMLSYVGSPVTYEQLMGLSGMAFILQADREHRWQGKVDAGWWPLDMWGLELRTSFLSQAVGFEVEHIQGGIAGKLPEFYREQIQTRLEQSIQAGKPAMMAEGFCTLIVGYDDAADRPPIWGRCARSTDARIDRCNDWPWDLWLLGKQREPMSPDDADEAALRHAVALAHDSAGPFDKPWSERRFSGQKAYAAWAGLLRDLNEQTEARHHANVSQNLKWNRTAAVKYLRAVAARRKGVVAEELRQAALAFEEVIGLASRLNPGGLENDTAKRQALAGQVEQIAAADLEAFRHIEKALAAQ